MDQSASLHLEITSDATGCTGFEVVERQDLHPLESRLQLRSTLFRRIGSGDSDLQLVDDWSGYPDLARSYAEEPLGDVALAPAIPPNWSS